MSVTLKEVKLETVAAQWCPNGSSTKHGQSVVRFSKFVLFTGCAPALLANNKLFVSSGQMI
jgi:hypothetical protein